MSLNKVILIGRLGNKPDGKYTPSGLSVCTFSIATNEIWMNANKEKQEHTEWHNIVTWNKTADFVSDNLDKGDMVYVEGKIRTRKYTTKDNINRQTTEVIATNLVALSSRKKTTIEQDTISKNNLAQNAQSHDSVEPENTSSEVINNTNHNEKIDKDSEATNNINVDIEPLTSEKENIDITKNKEEEENSDDLPF